MLSPWEEHIIEDCWSMFYHSVHIKTKKKKTISCVNALGNVSKNRATGKQAAGILLYNIYIGNNIMVYIIVNGLYGRICYFLMKKIIPTD